MKTGRLPRLSFQYGHQQLGQHLDVPRLAAGALVLSAALAACGHTAAGGSQPAAPVTTCIFGATGADVEVQFSNDTASCMAQEQNLASFGLSWYPLDGLIRAGDPGPADGEAEATACTLTRGGAVLTVMDAGGMSYGLQVCSANEQAGWAAVTP